ncbi:Pectinesterase inhibitor domain [Macleaya cordata]|uniref:Pectinesterase inhibitor domain n=1 Tax=Macleaya cordata TaxID=56857 RepID=A0A200QAT7_MACCD|nr:Pectinesterase inhibitor domain [Macleaya cordata]
MRLSFSLVSLSLPLFFFLLCFHGVNGVDITKPTCKKAAKSDLKLKYSFCLKSLKANPKSQNANLQELGILSTELAITNANSTSSYIKNLLKKNQKRVDNKYLKDCLELYTDAIPDLQEVLEAFKSRDYFKANIQMSSAMDASSTCEDGFKEKKGLVSPLTKKNNDFFQLTAIALAITNLVH